MSGAEGGATGRRKARELAFRALFQSERSGDPVHEVWEQVRADLTEGDETAGEAYGEVLDARSTGFADFLVSTWAEHREEIDSALGASLEGWTFNQMNQTDLNILRLAVTELLFDSDVPPEVTIEMAVRLARRFGGEESGKFVNGVLGKVYRGEAFQEARGG